MLKIDTEEREKRTTARLIKKLNILWGMNQALGLILKVNLNLQTEYYGTYLNREYIVLIKHIHKNMTRKITIIIFSLNNFHDRAMQDA